MLKYNTINIAVIPGKSNRIDFFAYNRKVKLQPADFTNNYHTATPAPALFSMCITSYLTKKTSNKRAWKTPNPFYGSGTNSL